MSEDKKVALEIDNVCKLNQYTAKVLLAKENIKNNFIIIIKNLMCVKENSLYKLNNYNDIYEYAEIELEFKSTSVKNFLNIGKKFCIMNQEGEFELKPEFKEFEYTKLVELLPVPEDKINEFSPGMSKREIIKKKETINIKKQNKIVDEGIIVEKKQVNSNSSQPVDNINIIYNDYEMIIKKYLDEFSNNDLSFKSKYMNSNKTIKDCFKYIINKIEKDNVKNEQVVMIEDSIVYSLAVHYYDEAL